MSAPASPDPEGREGRAIPRLLRIISVSSLLVLVVAIFYLAWCFLIGGAIIYSAYNYGMGNLWWATLHLMVGVGAAFTLLAFMVVLAILATRGR